MPPADDDTQTSVQQYLVIAGATATRPSADNPRRNYYMIQNIGLNEGLFWWEQASNSGQAMRFAPGDWFEWAAKCPVQSANFQSALGTTFAVTEGRK